MHRLRPADTRIQAALGEEPEGFLGTIVAGIVGIEEQRHLAAAESLREPRNLVDLMLGDLVRHEGHRRNPEGVEAEYVIESLHQDDAAGGDSFPVAGFLQPGGVLSEEFLAAVEVDREAVFGGLLLFAAQLGRQCVEGLFLRLKLRVAGGPREDLALLTEDRIEDLAAKRPAPLVVAAVLRQDPDSPFLHRSYGEAGMTADVACRRGRHVRYVPQELLIEGHELAGFLIVA